MVANGPRFLVCHRERDNRGCAIVGRRIIVFLRGVVGGRVHGTRSVEGAFGMEDALWVRSMLGRLGAGLACG